MSAGDKSYAVIRFNDDTFSEVPTNWLDIFDDTIKCWWPIKVKNVILLIDYHQIKQHGNYVM